LRECLGRGQCVELACVCDSGWSGPFCSDPLWQLDGRMLPSFVFPQPLLIDAAQNGTAITRVFLDGSGAMTSDDFECVAGPIRAPLRMVGSLEGECVWNVNDTFAGPALLDTVFRLAVLPIGSANNGSIVLPPGTFGIAIIDLSRGPPELFSWSLVSSNDDLAVVRVRGRGFSNSGSFSCWLGNVSRLAVTVSATEVLCPANALLPQALALGRTAALADRSEGLSFRVDAPLRLCGNGRVDSGASLGHGAGQSRLLTVARH
jgi:hypothetical protein